MRKFAHTEKISIKQEKRQKIGIKTGFCLFLLFFLNDPSAGAIGSEMPAKSLELRHTIRLIRELDAEIEAEIQTLIDKLHSPITAIPGIGTRMGAMIPAEVGDFSRFGLCRTLALYIPIRATEQCLCLNFFLTCFSMDVCHDTCFPIPFWRSSDLQCLFSPAPHLNTRYARVYTPKEPVYAAVKDTA